jgi:hypothetical protein
MGAFFEIVGAVLAVGPLAGLCYVGWYLDQNSNRSFVRAGTYAWLLMAGGGTILASGDLAVAAAFGIASVVPISFTLAAIAYERKTSDGRVRQVVLSLVVAILGLVPSLIIYFLLCVLFGVRLDS